MQNKLAFDIWKTQTKTDKVFRYFLFEKTQLPFQGWKIHVSAKYDNFNHIRKIVKKFCFDNKINFKFLKNKKWTLINLSRQAAREFSGKVITIYPQNSDEAKWILKTLAPKLKDFSAPYVLTDQRYKNTILYYRFGNIWSKLILHKQLLLYKDKREVGRFKPEEVQDLFPSRRNTSEEKFFHNKGYTFITPLHFSNFGGIYLVSKNDVCFVIKECRPHIGTSNKDNPLHYRTQEMLITKKISMPEIPKFIETFSLKGHKYFVYEWKPGLNLLQWQLILNLSFPWNLNDDNKGQAMARIEKLLDVLLNFLKKCKAINFFLNDIKAENFVWDGNDKLNYIDLEHSFFEHSTTKMLNPFQRTERTLSWDSEIRKVGFLLADMLSGSNNLANEFTNKIALIKGFEIFSRIRGINAKIVKKIVFLINFNKYKNLSAISKIKTDKEPSVLSAQFRSFSLRISDPFSDELFEALTQRVEKEEDNESNILWSNLHAAIIEKKFESAQKQLQLIWEKFSTVTKGTNIFCNDQKCTPYLLFGNAHFLFLVYIIREKIGKDIFLQEEETLLKTIISFLEFKCGLWEGNAGLIFILLVASYKKENSVILQKAIMEKKAIIETMYLAKRKAFFNSDKKLLKENENKWVRKIINLL